MPAETALPQACRLQWSSPRSVPLRNSGLRCRRFAGHVTPVFARSARSLGSLEVVRGHPHPRALACSPSPASMASPAALVPCALACSSSNRWGFSANNAFYQRRGGQSRTPEHPVLSGRCLRPGPSGEPSPAGDHASVAEPLWWRKAAAGVALTASECKATTSADGAAKTPVPKEVCELALAHVNSDRVEAAYRRSDLFDRRRELMAAWAAYSGVVSAWRGPCIGVYARPPRAPS